MWVFSTQYASCEYHKVQAREASSVGSYIHTSDLYKSYFTSAGLHPCWLDVALLCRPMRILKDGEVSQQCASSTGLTEMNPFRIAGWFWMRWRRRSASSILEWTSCAHTCKTRTRICATSSPPSSRFSGGREGREVFNLGGLIVCTGGTEGPTDQGTDPPPPTHMVPRNCQNQSFSAFVQVQWSGNRERRGV